MKLISNSPQDIIVRFEIDCNCCFANEIAFKVEEVKKDGTVIQTDKFQVINYKVDCSPDSTQRLPNGHILGSFIVKYLGGLEDGDYTILIDDLIESLLCSNPYILELRIGSSNTIKESLCQCEIIKFLFALMQAEANFTMIYGAEGYKRNLSDWVDAYIKDDLIKCGYKPVIATLVYNKNINETVEIQRVFLQLIDAPDNEEILSYDQYFVDFRFDYEILHLDPNQRPDMTGIHYIGKGNLIVSVDQIYPTIEQSIVDLCINSGGGECCDLDLSITNEQDCVNQEATLTIKPLKGNPKYKIWIFRKYEAIDWAGEINKTLEEYLEEGLVNCDEYFYSREVCEEFDSEYKWTHYKQLCFSNHSRPSCTNEYIIYVQDANGCLEKFEYTPEPIQIKQEETERTANSRGSDITYRITGGMENQWIMFSSLDKNNVIPMKYLGNGTHEGIIFIPKTNEEVIVYFDDNKNNCNICAILLGVQSNNPCDFKKIIASRPTFNDRSYIFIKYEDFVPQYPGQEVTIIITGSNGFKKEITSKDYSFNYSIDNIPTGTYTVDFYLSQNSDIPQKNISLYKIKALPQACPQKTGNPGSADGGITGTIGSGSGGFVFDNKAAPGKGNFNTDLLMGDANKDGILPIGNQNSPSNKGSSLLGGSSLIGMGGISSNGGSSTENPLLGSVDNKGNQTSNPIFTGCNVNVTTGNVLGLTPKNVIILNNLGSSNTKSSPDAKFLNLAPRVRYYPSFGTCNQKYDATNEKASQLKSENIEDFCKKIAEIYGPEWKSKYDGNIEYIGDDTIKITTDIRKYNTLTGKDICTVPINFCMNCDPYFIMGCMTFLQFELIDSKCSGTSLLKQLDCGHNTITIVKEECDKRANILTNVLTFYDDKNSKITHLKTGNGLIDIDLSSFNISGSGTEISNKLFQTLNTATGNLKTYLDSKSFKVEKIVDRKLRFTYKYDKSIDCYENNSILLKNDYIDYPYYFSNPLACCGDIKECSGVKCEGDRTYIHFDKIDSGYLQLDTFNSGKGHISHLLLHSDLIKQTEDIRYYSDKVKNIMRVSVRISSNNSGRISIYNYGNLNTGYILGYDMKYQNIYFQLKLSGDNELYTYITKEKIPLDQWVTIQVIATFNNEFKYFIDDINIVVQNDTGVIINDQVNKFGSNLQIDNRHVNIYKLALVHNKLKFCENIFYSTNPGTFDLKCFYIAKYKEGQSDFNPDICGCSEKLSENPQILNILTANVYTKAIIDGEFIKKLQTPAIKGFNYFVLNRDSGLTIYDADKNRLILDSENTTSFLKCYKCPTQTCVSLCDGADVQINILEPEGLTGKGAISFDYKLTNSEISYEFIVYNKSTDNKLIKQSIGQDSSIVFGALDFGTYSIEIYMISNGTKCLCHSDAACFVFVDSPRNCTATISMDATDTAIDVNTGTLTVKFNGEVINNCQYELSITNATTNQLIKKKTILGSSDNFILEKQPAGVYFAKLILICNGSKFENPCNTVIAEIKKPCKPEVQTDCTRTINATAVNASIETGFGSIKIKFLDANGNDDAGKEQTNLYLINVYKGNSLVKSITDKFLTEIEIDHKIAGDYRIEFFKLFNDGSKTICDTEFVTIKPATSECENRFAIEKTNPISAQTSTGKVKIITTSLDGPAPEAGCQYIFVLYQNGRQIKSSVYFPTADFTTEMKDLPAGFYTVKMEKLCRGVGFVLECSAINFELKDPTIPPRPELTCDATFTATKVIKSTPQNPNLNEIHYTVNFTPEEGCIYFLNYKQEGGEEKSIMISGVKSGIIGPLGIGDVVIKLQKMCNGYEKQVVCDIKSFVLGYVVPTPCNVVANTLATNITSGVLNDPHHPQVGGIYKITINSTSIQPDCITKLILYKFENNNLTLIYEEEIKFINNLPFIHEHINLEPGKYTYKIIKDCGGMPLECAQFITNIERMNTETPTCDSTFDLETIILASQDNKKGNKINYNVYAIETPGCIYRITCQYSNGTKKYFDSTGNATGTFSNIGAEEILIKLEKICDGFSPVLCLIKALTLGYIIPKPCEIVATTSFKNAVPEIIKSGLFSINITNFVKQDNCTLVIKLYKVNSITQEYSEYSVYRIYNDTPLPAKFERNDLNAGLYVYKVYRDCGDKLFECASYIQNIEIDVPICNVPDNYSKFTVKFSRKTDMNVAYIFTSNQCTYEKQLYKTWSWEFDNVIKGFNYENGPLNYCNINPDDPNAIDFYFNKNSAPTICNCPIKILKNDQTESDIVVSITKDCCGISSEITECCPIPRTEEKDCFRSSNGEFMVRLTNFECLVNNSYFKTYNSYIKLNSCNHHNNICHSIYNLIDTFDEKNTPEYSTYTGFSFQTYQNTLIAPCPDSTKKYSVIYIYEASLFTIDIIRTNISFRFVLAKNLIDNTIEFIIQKLKFESNKYSVLEYKLYSWNIDSDDDLFRFEVFTHITNMGLELQPVLRKLYRSGDTIDSHYANIYEYTESGNIVITRQDISMIFNNFCGSQLTDQLRTTFSNFFNNPQIDEINRNNIISYWNVQRATVYGSIKDLINKHVSMTYCTRGLMKSNNYDGLPNNAEVMRHSMDYPNYIRKNGSLENAGLFGLINETTQEVFDPAVGLTQKIVLYANNMPEININNEIGYTDANQVTHQGNMWICKECDEPKAHFMKLFLSNDRIRVPNYILESQIYAEAKNDIYVMATWARFADDSFFIVIGEDHYHTNSEFSIELGDDFMVVRFDGDISVRIRYEDSNSFPLIDKKKWNHYMIIVDSNLNGLDSIKFYVNNVLRTPIASDGFNGQSINLIKMIPTSLFYGNTSPAVNFADYFSFAITKENPTMNDINQLADKVYKYQNTGVDGKYVLTAFNSLGPQKGFYIEGYKYSNNRTISAETNSGLYHINLGDINDPNTTSNSFEYYIRRSNNNTQTNQMFELKTLTDNETPTEENLKISHDATMYS